VVSTWSQCFGLCHSTDEVRSFRSRVCGLVYVIVCILCTTHSEDEVPAAAAAADGTECTDAELGGCQMLRV